MKKKGATPKSSALKTKRKKSLKNRPTATVQIAAELEEKLTRKQKDEIVETFGEKFTMRVRRSVDEDRAGSRHGDRYVLKKIFVEDAYGKAMTKHRADAANPLRSAGVGRKRQRVRKVLDLGANIGAFSVQAAMRGAAEVVAVEPDVESHKLMVANLQDAMKKFKSRSTKPKITPICGAVSHRVGEDPLYLRTKIRKGVKEDELEYRPDHPNRNSLIKDAVNNSEDLVQEVKAVWSMEEVCTRYKPSLIKMDVEGSEVEIFKSLRKLPASVEELLVYYHFDKHPTMKTFGGFVASLERIFKYVQVVNTPQVPKGWDWRTELKKNPQLAPKNPGGFASAKKDILVYCAVLKPSSKK
eukprot:gnl/TRDRNA2_/TRDRNA2_159646_c0_seq1.p1 gnl/TRDRNA2_/TRDRNA2_159646_c0~~gnl/TRDRNA2_/TRDRNA2_159646_c0_seq1.p1  ORF type:complete len:355 (+),score=69.56 gnl/TRDRNA2_/TRDRNA2_159646_c0_seq1:163-1227(+)